jgi:hypothetical protein
VSLQAPDRMDQMSVKHVLAALDALLARPDQATTVRLPRVRSR